MTQTTVLSFIAALACHALVLVGVRLPSPLPSPEKEYVEVTLAASAPPIEAQPIAPPMPVSPAVLDPTPIPPPPEPVAPGPPTPPSPLEPVLPKPEERPAPPPEPEPPPVPKTEPPKSEITPEPEKTEPIPQPKQIEQAPLPAQSVQTAAIPAPSTVSHNPATPSSSTNSLHAAARYQSVEQPYYIKRGKAKYPAEAKRLRQEGVVVLGLYINESGRLDKIEVVQSSGFPLLDRAAIAAERSARFRPAYLRDQPIACKAEVPYRFVLPK